MIQQLPSIYDQIANGVNQGQQSFNQQRQYQDTIAQRNLQNMLGLYESGDISADNANQNPTLKAMGVSLNPTAAELKNMIATGATPSSSLTSDQRSAMGLPSLGQVAKDNLMATAAGGGGQNLTPDQRAIAGLPSTAQQSAEQAADAISKIQLRAAKGDPTLTDNEYMVAGLKTPGEMQAQKLKDFDPLITQKAEQYVAGVTDQLGGRINPSQAAKAGEMAYQKYVSDLAMTRMGQMDPEQASYARSFFQQAVLNQLNDQRMRDIQMTMATAGKVPEADRIYGELGTSGAQEQAAMDDLTGKNPGIAILANKPDAQISPAMQGFVNAYRAHAARRAAIQKAQAIALFGGSRDAISKALGMDPDDLSPPAAGGDTGGTGGTPRPPRTKAPTPKAPPPVAGAGATTSTSATVPDMSDKDLKTAIATMQGLTDQMKKIKIENGLKAGIISAGDAAKLKQRFRIQ